MVLPEVEARPQDLTGSQARHTLLIAAVVAGSAIALSWAAGSAVPALFVEILLLAAAWRPDNLAAGLSLSALGNLSAALVIATVPPAFGVAGGFPMFSAALLATSMAAIWKAGRNTPEIGRSLRHIPWGVLVGPVLLLGAAVVYAVRFGPIPAWAMSGDTRNHLLIIDAIRENGGWTFLTEYPALHNALVWMLTPPPLTAAPGTALVAQLQVAAQALLMVLTLLGLLAGLLAAGKPLSNLGNLRAAAGSALVVSPLLLTGVLVIGFHSVPTAVLILVALAALLILGEPGPLLATVAAAAATVLLIADYPVVAPMAAAALFGWWLTRGEKPGRRILVPAAAAALAMVLLWVALTVVARQAELVAILTAPGGMIRRHPFLLVGVAALALLTWAGNQTWMQVRSLSITILGCVFLAEVVLWLVSLGSGWSYSYYAEKSLWVGALGLLPPALARVADRAPDTFRRSLPALCMYAFLTWVPALFGAQGTWVPIAAMANGWQRPDAAEARLVQQLPDLAQHSYAWRVDEPDSDRVLNTWLSSWNLDPGSVKLSEPSVSWAYGIDDIHAARPFCFLLAGQPDSVVWTDTAQEAERLRRACTVPDHRVRVITSD